MGKDFFVLTREGMEMGEPSGADYFGIRFLMR